ncbi:MAG TPA: hypothetical protein VFA15_00495, partial [Nitrososphaera sp.]|nr:hypothetical protein [Nitrososphaera sp.]
VSLAAALAIPFETTAGRFPHRDLLIFITFCVLIATLILQGGTLPYLIRLLRIKDDGVNAREEAKALASTAKAGLKEIDKLEQNQKIPPKMLEMLRTHLGVRWQEFSGDGDVKAAQMTALYRRLESELLDAQRKELVRLRDTGKIDNTVMRRIQRLLDLETASVQLLGTTGHSEISDIEELD